MSIRKSIVINECPSLVENLPKREAAPTADSPLREPVAGTPQFPISIFRDNLTRSESVWHWHEEFEAGYVTEGAAILDAGSHRLALRAGDAYFINSNIIHSVRNAAPGEECMLNALVFHGSIVGGAKGRGSYSMTGEKKSRSVSRCASAR